MSQTSSFGCRTLDNYKLFSLPKKKKKKVDKLPSYFFYKCGEAASETGSAKVAQNSTDRCYQMSRPKSQHTELLPARLNGIKNRYLSSTRKGQLFIKDNPGTSPKAFTVSEGTELNHSDKL